MRCDPCRIFFCDPPLRAAMKIDTEGWCHTACRCTKASWRWDAFHRKRSRSNLLSDFLNFYYLLRGLPLCVKIDISRTKWVASMVCHLNHMPSVATWRKAHHHHPNHTSDRGTLQGLCWLIPTAIPVTLFRQKEVSQFGRKDWKEIPMRPLPPFSEQRRMLVHVRVLA